MKSFVLAHVMLKSMDVKPCCYVSQLVLSFHPFLALHSCDAVEIFPYAISLSL